MCMAQDQWSLRFFDIRVHHRWMLSHIRRRIFFRGTGNMHRGDISGVSEKVHRMCCCAAAVCGSQGHMMRLFEPVQCLVVVDAYDGVVVGHVAGYLVVPGGAGSIALIHVGDGLAAVETASGTEIVLSQGS